MRDEDERLAELFCSSRRDTAPSAADPTARPACTRKTGTASLPIKLKISATASHSSCAGD